MTLCCSNIYTFCECFSIIELLTPTNKKQKPTENGKQICVSLRSQVVQDCPPWMISLRQTKPYNTNQPLTSADSASFGSSPPVCTVQRTVTRFLFTYVHIHPNCPEQEPLTDTINPWRLIQHCVLNIKWSSVFLLSS